MFSNSKASWLPLVALVAAAAQSEKPLASLSGTVTNGVTAEPLLRAHVTVHCNGSGRDQSPEPTNFGALTNGEGKFTVGQLPSGNCSVTASKVGFTPLAEAFASLQIASGDRKDGVKLKLTPNGSIVGHVLDADGAPVENAQVIVEGRSGQMNATSDDKGQFRVGGLRPGKYHLRANTMSLGLPPETRTDGKKDLHDAATYYPGSLTAKEAQWLEVKAGSEITGIDVRLLRTPIVTVSGKVLGMPPGSKYVMMSASPNQQGGGVKADGTFQMWSLDPGKYTLVAVSYGQGNGQSRLQSAPLEIEVGTTNLEHLELHMVPPFDIPGEVRFDEDGARMPPNAPNGRPVVRDRRLVLMQVDEQNGEPASATLDANDRFTLEKVQPGLYHVQLSWGPSYVRSVRVGSTETAGDVLDVRNGFTGPLTLTVSANTCELTGKVTDAKGPVTNATVALMRADEIGGPRVAGINADGVYKFTGLAPGKYKIEVGEQSGPISGRNRGAGFDDTAEEVELRAGDKLTKDLQRK